MRYLFHADNKREVIKSILRDAQNQVQEEKNFVLFLGHQYRPGKRKKEKINKEWMECSVFILVIVVYAYTVVSKKNKEEIRGKNNQKMSFSKNPCRWLQQSKPPYLN